MEPTPAPKKRDYSGRVYGPRQCEDCLDIFTPGSSGQKRCPACQRERDLRLKCEFEQRKREAARPVRYCAGCGVELPPSIGRPPDRCEACRPAHRKRIIRDKNREYTATGRRKEWDQRYERANVEAIREMRRRGRQAHPERDLAAIHRRRMRIEAGKLDDLDRLLSTLYRCAIKHDPCFYCGSPDTQCVDHYFAIAKGGSDRWFNLVRACRACNLSKRVMCGTAFLLLSGG